MNDFRLPLLKFDPILLSKPWGGDALWRILNKGASNDLNGGEAWELSDRPEAATKVAGGRLDGMNLPGLIVQYSKELFGAEFAGSFPLLYKFICAREKLSVQVHPGAGSSLGEAKTECWYVVDAQPGAELIVGVASGGKSKDKVLELLKSPRCQEVLRRWPVQRGDVFFIPAGTVHAITEGLLLYEVQQNSDTTFRLYDWGRVDFQGRPRALHVEQAAQVADLEKHEGYRIAPLRVERNSHVEDYLVACPYFALMKWHGFRTSVRFETAGKFRVLTMVSGSLTASAEGEDPMRMNIGDTVLVPASIKEVRFEAVSPDTEVIVSFIPDVEHDIRTPLKSAGYDDVQIEALSGPVGLRI